MKRIPITCAMLCCVFLPAFAEMAPQPQPYLVPGSSNTWSLDWDGVPERTYFTKWSFDLKNWFYTTNVEYGPGVNHTPFNSSSTKFFVRLLYTEVPTNNAELADFDFDGLGNLAELALGTDPLDADSDHDGIIDGVEVSNGGDPLSNVDGDPLRAVDSDGDGVSDAVELARGTSPTLWDSDGDGFGDADDEFPLDPSRHTSPPTAGDTTKPTVTLESPANSIFVSGP